MAYPCSRVVSPAGPSVLQHLQILQTSTLWLTLIETTFGTMYRHTLFLTLMLVVILAPFAKSQDGTGDQNATDSRDGKLFSLFTIVRFPNDACRASSGDNGTCLTSSECSSSSGASSGSCASGFGVCCVFTATCGSTTNRNCTYFTNPGYTSSSTGALNCQLTVNKCSSNVCQLRLDYENFVITTPTSDIDANAVTNTCDVDQFSVSGGTAATFGPLCGTNTGLHTYIDVGRNSGPCTLSMVLGSATGDRTWKIKISQIECCSELMAPSGCEQYYTGITGTLYSYNFNSANTNIQHLANQCYGICIRMEAGFCTIQYSQNTAITPTTDGFDISGPTDPLATAGDNCDKDYVIIPKGTSPLLAANDRFCGTRLGKDGETANAPEVVTSNVKPFILTFVTDGTEDAAELGRRGFCLNYSQQPCTAAGK